MTNINERESKVVPFWRSGFNDLDRVFDNFKKDFENIFSTNPLHHFESSTSCNLVDEGDKFVITADMPRVKKEEINLDVGDDYIDISAEHKESDEEKKKKYIRKEHSEISIHRRMSLPDKVKPADVKAKLNNGVLTIDIPKEKPTTKPNTTKIRVE